MLHTIIVFYYHDSRKKAMREDKLWLENRTAIYENEIFKTRRLVISKRVYHEE